MKSYVTIEQAVCPICAKEFDTGSLLMDNRLRDRFDRTTTTGFQICPDDLLKGFSGIKAGGGPMTGPWSC